MSPNSDPPELIADLVAQARSGCEVLLGIARKQPRVSLLRRMGSRLFHWYCRTILQVKLLENGTNFRVLERQAVNALTQIRDRHRYLRFMSVQIGFCSKSFLYDPICRSGRPRIRPLAEAVDIALHVIMNTSRHPLRLVSWLGIIASGANIVYALYVIYSLLFGTDLEPGWASLCLQNAAMFFFVFLILTVLSEYVGHILSESRQRPLYHVIEELHSATLVPHAERRNVVREALE
jgi:dolichol-phosphate mannosyltransferase